MRAGLDKRRAKRGVEGVVATKKLAHYQRITSGASVLWAAEIEAELGEVMAYGEGRVIWTLEGDHGQQAGKSIALGISHVRKPFVLRRSITGRFATGALLVGCLLLMRPDGLLSGATSSRWELGASKGHVATQRLARPRMDLGS